MRHIPLRHGVRLKVETAVIVSIHILQFLIALQPIPQLLDPCLSLAIGVEVLSNRFICILRFLLYYVFIVFSQVTLHSVYFQIVD